MSERWKLGWLESYNAYTGEPERFVYRPGDDEHTRICVRGENCDEDARRIVASVNACLGIPTETLEAGVVVVPVEALPDPEKLRRIADFIDKVWPYESDPKAPGDLRRWADRIEAAVSRLRPPGRPGTGLTVTLTDEERQIVCEALSVYTDHCAEYEDHPTAAVRETASTKKLKAWAILSRFQQNGGGSDARD